MDRVVEAVRARRHRTTGNLQRRRPRDHGPCASTIRLMEQEDGLLAQRNGDATLVYRQPSLEPAFSVFGLGLAVVGLWLRRGHSVRERVRWNSGY
jgi:hypothetical protein